MIYLDNAATSYYRPDTVAEAVAQAIRTMGNCSRGAYEAALTSARAVYGTRALVSELFHGEGPEQVAFTANSTESLNIAIKGVLETGDRVVATVLDHNSVLRPLYEMERQGAELVIVGCTDEKDRGCLDYGAMEAAIRPGTKAVVCTHASNLTGNLVDIRRIGGWCRKAGALFIVDASQTAGVFPIDMERDMIDILCFTGHKGLMGPQGTGAICLAEWQSLKPVKVGGSGFASEQKEQPPVMPEVLEAGTLNGHGIAGLHAALQWIKERGIENLRRKELSLARRFYEGIAGILGIRVYGDFTSWDRCAVVSFTVVDCYSVAVSTMLWEDAKIACRSGMHCAYPMHQALGTESQGTVRFSFSHFNTEEEVDLAICAVKRLGEDLV